MITPEMLGIDSKGVKRIEVITAVDDGLSVCIDFENGERKFWHYKAVPTEENRGQRYSPIKWVKV